MATLDELTTKAGDDDVVAGVPARLVAAPRDTAEAAALIEAARGLSVVVRGGGTKLDWGVPPRELDLIIDTRRLAGVVEHAAGDLITVVRAGTRMAELHGLPGQQLALDAPPAATAGGTVAANASGPRRLRYGTARDLLIGITVVRPDGTITKSGGKVVKNVAGYDLGKLYTGAFGTLGLITECVFRLHPVPAASVFVRACAPPGHAARVLAGQFAASALEVCAAPGTEPELAVLLEGTPAGVRERAAAVAALLDGAVAGTPPEWWDVPPWPPGGVGIKLTGRLSQVPALVATAVGAGATVRGSAGTGVLYAGFPPVAECPDGTVEAGRAVELLRAAAVRAGGHAVVLTAPAGVRETLDMWGPVPGLALMRRVKDQFDPEHRFAPGRFVGGI
ncbi:glycolate oxidase FAD binding subunit [Actinoplanes octamycinicus]|uniref:Glycolate oxidase FAD binding subunit n=1 Tax=Actinoplanes octamycinicus TaxID=135948 RepID=A0A7W7M8E3_9ACTN|nr:FAD-binding oxidoreductase [Actinoplanes octamycinicus]MBB4740779.1 glycolate oxidase FAD binding subunit [Actinoplanes octamycinicus]GIE61682.1 glycolate oxidase [Actinoplanes octamycinicus]